VKNAMDTIIMNLDYTLLIMKANLKIDLAK
jgi:hypothetical protein